MLDEARSRVLDPRFGDEMQGKSVRRRVMDVSYHEGKLNSVRVLTWRWIGGLPRGPVGATMSAYRWKRWAATAEVAGE